VEDWNWETIFHGHCRSIFNHCDIIGLKICQIRWKKCKIGLKAITAFKVIKVNEVGTNRKPVRDFLLVIAISYRFGVRSLLFKFWTLCIFEPPFGGISDNVRCSSWAHCEAHSRLPISVNWSFFARCYGWVTTSEEIENRLFRSNAVSLIQNFG